MKPFNQPAIKLSIGRPKTLQLAAVHVYDLPMANSPLYPRFAESLLIEALADSPAVLIYGPRQCGKTTLAQRVGQRMGYTYINFDDDVAHASAEADPAGFVDDLPDRVTLDEVQRVPTLFAALKTAIDRKRSPGRYILTGSAHVLLVPKLADSLAGRLELLRLHPLAQCELGRREPDFLDTLFTAGFKTRRSKRLGNELRQRIVAGGYPASLARSTERRRAVWYRDYLDALVQRDVRDLSRISTLHALPRLLTLAAGQTARLLNVTDLAAPFQLSRPTIRDYVTLLERIFLLETLPPWHSNRLSRLIKTPKLHMGDTGLSAVLLGIDSASLATDRTLLGQLLETFVFQELRRQASWHNESSQFFHFRDKDGVEVDFVIERGARMLAGVEVKASATVTASDFRGLRKLQQAAGPKFAGGVVLYDGETCASFGEGLHAVPLRRLWESA